MMNGRYLQALVLGTAVSVLSACGGDVEPDGIPIDEPVRPPATLTPNDLAPIGPNANPITEDDLRPDSPADRNPPTPSAPNPSPGREVDSR